jgi:hypothetical protein
MPGWIDIWQMCGFLRISPTVTGWILGRSISLVMESEMKSRIDQFQKTAIDCKRIVIIRFNWKYNQLQEPLHVCRDCCPSYPDHSSSAISWSNAHKSPQKNASQNKTSLVVVLQHIKLHHIIWLTKLLGLDPSPAGTKSIAKPIMPDMPGS